MKKYENGREPIKCDIFITQYLRSILELKLSLMAAEGYKICLKSRKETVLFRPLLSIKKNQIKGKKHTGEERSL